MKFKLFRKDFQKYENDIYILPYIRIYLNNMIYDVENFSICFGWFIWHGRFLWLAKENEHDGE